MQSARVRDYQCNPLWMNLEDAEARGISDRDIIKIVSEMRATLGGA